MRTSKKAIQNLIKKDGSTQLRFKNSFGNARVSPCKGGYKLHATTSSKRGVDTADTCNILFVLQETKAKYITGNDAPRGGASGDYIKVSKSTYGKLVNLLS